MGVGHPWMHAFIANLVVTRFLSRAIDVDGQPLFIVKGGVAMQLRLGKHARLSADFDVVFTGQEARARLALEHVFLEELDGFTGRVRQKDPWSGDRLHAHILRFEVALLYQQQPFKTIALELVIDEVEHEVIPVQFETTELTPTFQESLQAPLLALSRQIAEKLHACTEPGLGETPNGRVSDVYDLLILFRIAEQRDELSMIADVARRIFADRDSHHWPPTFTQQQGWVSEWARLVDTLPMETLGLPKDLAAALSELQQRIDDFK